MSKTSKKYFDEKFKKEIWSDFLKKVNRSGSSTELQKALSKALTQNEIMMLEKRLGVLYLVDKGFKYRDISEIVDVMPATISYIKKGFKKSAKLKEAVKENSKNSAVPRWMLKKYSKLPGYSKGHWKVLKG